MLNNGDDNASITKGNAMKGKKPLFRLSLAALISFRCVVALSASAAEMAVKPLQSGGAEVTFTLQRPGQVSLAVYGGGERLLRTLLSARPLGIGRRTVCWDGLDRDGAAQPPGGYAVKLLKTDGLRSEPAAQVGINPVPFWEEGIGNHAPTTSIAVDAEGIILIPNISEGGFDIAKIRPDRSYVWSGINVNMSTFAHVYALAGQTATKRVRNSFGWGHNPCAVAIVDGVAYMLRNNGTVHGTNSQTGKMIGDLWSAQWNENPDETDRGGVRIGLGYMDMDARGDVAVVSYRRHDAVRVYDLKTGKVKAEVKEIKEPLGVAVDGEGNALVVSEGAIVKIKNGLVTPFIPAGELAAPWRLSLDRKTGELLVALTVSFMCSLMEATLLSLTPSQVAEITERRPKLGMIWNSFKLHIERPIAVILTMNTAAHTIGASVAGAQFGQIFGNKWLWLFSVVLTLVMFQFTEILPKVLGVRFNSKLACLIARPLNLGTKLLTPVIRLSHLANRPFIEKGNGTTTAALDEISALASMARLSNEITRHQERIIKSASRLSGMRVRQVMIPAEQVSFLSTSQTLPEALVAAHIDAHTRYPVCEGDDKNRVIGYLNFKEMVYFMRTNPNDPSLRGIVRPVYFASPDGNARDLLTMFVDQHIHMAIVRSPLGKTLGLVTLEDLLEELVGDIDDEFDRLPRMVHPLSGGTWMIGGGLATAELCRQLGLQIADCQGTVADWLAGRLARIPKPGDTHREGSVEFTVRRVRRGRIFEVAVSLPGSTPTAVSPASPA